jgi:hypothetical protein
MCGIVPFWTRRDNRHAPRNATVIFSFVYSSIPFIRSFVHSRATKFTVFAFKIETLRHEIVSICPCDYTID